ncbi:MAG: sigma-54-dependent Fis family transcriptional regulator, partial [Desulfopila sp.]|nr:sigma-54-dependent Fis family transcriptional regulator [Desulfopila sp.]
QTLKEGVTTAENDAWDVVLLDIHMPDGNGLEHVPQIVKGRHEPEVIIVTGDGAPDGAERAIHGGAWTYIEKINVIRDLPLHLMRALQYREEKQRARSVPVILKRKNIIGDSEPMQRCFEDLVKAAASDVNVLITGETGTGKEVFARAVHENSARATGNFVVVDCASLPENLIESALFGHIKGAFTGADGSRKGLIKHADKGTLFLDEVGELPPSMQKTFLRVLQERRFRPIGAEREIGSDFRLLAATNRNLEEMVSQGLFREDLLYRLKGLSL